MKGYLEASGRAPFLAGDSEELATLLDAFSLERALLELEFELTHRRHLALVPLYGISQLLARSWVARS